MCNAVLLLSGSRGSGKTHCSLFSRRYLTWSEWRESQTTCKDCREKKNTYILSKIWVSVTTWPNLKKKYWSLFARYFVYKKSKIYTPLNTQNTAENIKSWKRILSTTTNFIYFYLFIIVYSYVTCFGHCWPILRH